eukprot:CAMPEP_0175868206 /NCGR_PEP_ID=MMETSP0107_2-20121207/35263_1 /TAXON_ID=195067 ORGANISM="Goniomonas pacifica, Strain CCMP1869" /NCGR_SAMPLE_ID=MMETSP0107_2 /ASSEMBLY_ACC=CAM_ASM_000203 /LENGTH=179 /DNA_ID=CAMNT_0017186073 /DNA_START=101 /DNA_END=637 /DNA_ORIENTATION=+
MTYSPLARLAPTFFATNSSMGMTPVGSLVNVETLDVEALGHGDDAGTMAQCRREGDGGGDAAGVGGRVPVDEEKFDREKILGGEERHSLDLALESPDEGTFMRVVPHHKQQREYTLSPRSSSNRRSAPTIARRTWFTNTSQSGSCASRSRVLCVLHRPSAQSTRHPPRTMLATNVASSL